VSFQEYQISDILQQELSQNEIVILDETNKLQESTALYVKRKLFMDSTSQKENNNTSNMIVNK